MDKLILTENGVQFLSAYKEIGHSREEIIEGHKDLIFILSPAEWKEWIKSYFEIMQTIQALRTEDEQLQAIMSASKRIKLKLAPLFLMSLLQKRFGKLGVLACIPEDYYVISFFQEEQRTEKMARVLEAVRQYEEKYGNGDPLFIQI